MKKVILTCFIVLILSISVNAIGLRAMKLNNEIFFEPYFEGTYHFSAIPLNEEPMDIEVYVDDSLDDGTVTNLSKYFKLSDTIFRQTKIKEDPSFSVTVNLPAKIKEPGTHKVRVGVRELPKNLGGLAVRTAIESLFFIQVPFEGKYIVFSIDAISVNREDEVPINLYFSSKGDQSISEAYAKLQIIDSSGNVVENLETEKFSLAPIEDRKITLSLPGNKLYAGTYLIKGTVYYDGDEETAMDELKIGKLDFKIINQTDSLVTGRINEFFVDVESEWADLIDNVYAEVMVIKGPGTEVKINTLSKTFSGFERGILSGFFDTTGFEPGEYKVIITLHYGDQKKTKETMVSIQKESALRMPNINASVNQILFGIIILIILIINIILFIILIKKKDKHENEIKPQ